MNKYLAWSWTTLKDKKRNEIIRKTLRVACSTEKIREARFRWYGYVMRRDDENSMKRIMTAEVNGRCSRGQQKKRWALSRHDTARREVTPFEERRHWWQKEVEKKDPCDWLHALGGINSRLKEIYTLQHNWSLDKFRRLTYHRISLTIWYSVSRNLFGEE